MTEHELGIELKKMYENAPKGEVNSQILLFGIKYAAEIKSNYRDIVKISGIRESYMKEVYKGMKLAKYVTVKTTLL